MQKIKECVMQGLYKSALSKKTLVLMLDLLNLADEKGEVVLYYKDYLKMADISNSQFYNSINELKADGFITESKSILHKNEKIIHITNNVFAESKDYKSYVDTNDIWFTERKYAELKAGEIKAFLYFHFKISKKGYSNNKNKSKDEMKEKNKIFYSTKPAHEFIADNIGSSVRMAKEYCKSLKENGFIYQKINHELKERKNKVKKSIWEIITINSKWLAKSKVSVSQKGIRVDEDSKDLFLCDCHTVKNLCRRYDVEYDDTNMIDTALLIGQYKNTAEKQNLDSRKLMNTAFKNFKDKILNSKTIHYILKSLLEIKRDSSLVFQY